MGSVSKQRINGSVAPILPRRSHLHLFIQQKDIVLNGGTRNLYGKKLGTRELFGWSEREREYEQKRVKEERRKREKGNNKHRPLSSFISFPLLSSHDSCIFTFFDTKFLHFVPEIERNFLCIDASVDCQVTWWRHDDLKVMVGYVVQRY